MIIAPSILSADFANLAADVKAVEKPAQNICTLILWTDTSLTILRSDQTSSKL